MRETILRVNRAVLIVYLSAVAFAVAGTAVIILLLLVVRLLSGELYVS